MYHIGICDDRESDLRLLEQLVLTSTEYDDTMQIHLYLSGIEFLEVAEKKSMDLVILDMQMKGLSGYETAAELRKYNKEIVVAFCSAVCMPQPEYFEVQPFRYLMKYETVEKQKQIIQDLLTEMKRCSHKMRLEVSADGKAMLLDAQEILYMEKMKRGTRITLSPESILYDSKMKITVHERLEELEKELHNEGFARPHLSYLVNMKFIKAVDNQELLLINGERISITKSRRENFHHEFSKFFTKKYRRDKK